MQAFIGRNRFRKIYAASFQNGPGVIHVRHGKNDVAPALHHHVVLWPQAGHRTFLLDQVDPKTGNREPSNFTFRPHLLAYDKFESELLLVPLHRAIQISHRCRGVMCFQLERIACRLSAEFGGGQKRRNKNRERGTHGRTVYIQAIRIRSGRPPKKRNAFRFSWCERMPMHHQTINSYLYIFTNVILSLALLFTTSVSETTGILRVIMKTSTRCVLGVFALAFAALTAQAQTAGSISGLVTDQSGSLISNAKLIVTNPQTQFTRETTSNNAGNYNFPELPPGSYDVRAEAQGFEAQVHTAVELQVQQSARLDFRMVVGAVTETVEVSGGTPLVNTENATVGTVIDNKRIVDLPLNGRSFVSLISLSPNVITGQTSNTGWSVIRGNADRGSVSVSISGLRREFTYYTMDGTSNSEVDFNTYTLLPSIDALQEFKVQSGVYSAEFGREAAQVNISTKSGTNEYHGTVFEFLRNNVLDARPYGFTSVAPESSPFKWNQFGFTLGGPVQIPKLFNGRNRLFFLSNYEGFRLRTQAQQTYTVPSAAMRTGNFSELLPGTAIKDPATGQPFPGNIIPSTMLDPVALNVLNYKTPVLYPLPNVPGAGLGNNYLALLHSSTNKDQFTQRIDFVESEKSSWFGRFSWQDEGSVTDGSRLTGAGGLSPGLVSTGVKQAMISNSRIFSPNLVNEFHFGYSGYNNAVLSNSAYNTNVTKDLGIQLYAGLPPIAWGVPDVIVPGFSGFSDNYNAPYTVHEQTFQWTDGVTWTHGSHSLRIGADIRRDRYDAIGGQVSMGFYVFGGVATGYGFGDFMLGKPFVTSATANLGQGQFRATSQAYYVNDNWKVRPNLTIEMGLRYEYTPAWSSKGDSMSNIVVPYVNTMPNAPLDQHPYLARDCAAYGQDTFYPPGSIVRFDPAVATKCVSGSGTSIVKNDLTNWAPRLGIAWSPSPKWTVRTGAGIFYAQDQGDTFFDSALDLGGKTITFANNFNLSFANPFNLGSNNPCGTTLPTVCISSPLFLGNGVDRRTPFVVQYLLNFQHQLSASTVLEFGYLGSQGHRLQRPLGYNEAAPSATGSVNSRLPYPELSLLQVTEGVAKSNYNAASVKLTRRLSQGLSFLAGYTYSKSLDDGSGIRAPDAANTTTPQIPSCYTCEYSLSDFDSRHRFVASVLYELPFGRGKQFLNRGIASNVLGGWQVNSIVSISTGFPLEILDGNNQSNTSFGNNRPNAVLGASETGPKTTQEWFNIQSVQLQPFGTYGNLARNTATGPGVMSWDFSTLKNFNLNERTYVQFRFEAFNFANHPNFGDPNTTLSSNRLNSNGIAIPGSGAFGTITSTRPGIDMRELQLSLKLVF